MSAYHSCSAGSSESSTKTSSNAASSFCWRGRQGEVDTRTCTYSVESRDLFVLLMSVQMLMFLCRACTCGGWVGVEFFCLKGKVPIKACFPPRVHLYAICRYSECKDHLVLSRLHSYGFCHLPLCVHDCGHPMCTRCLDRAGGNWSPFRPRNRRQKEFDAGVLPDFLPETKHIREDPSWRVRKQYLPTVTG